MYYICLMSDAAAAKNDASVQVGGHYGAALENLRSTVKWLVASAGAVVAAIIAGAQLVDYSGRTVWGASLAALSVVTALSITIVLLVRAAKILTVSRPTATDLSNAEMRAGALDQQRRTTGQIDDTNVEWLLARRTYLLGRYPTVTELLSAYNRATDDVENESAKESAQRLASSLRQRIGTVEEAAHYRAMSRAYDALLKGFRKGAILFIVAVLLFSVSGLFRKATRETPSNAVTTPIPVRVIVTGTPVPCADRIGVAVGGTLTSPTVVMPPVGQCPAGILTPQQSGAVVIPQLPSSSPTGGPPR